MVHLVLWFAMLFVFVKFTKGWTRGILITLFVLGTILVLL